MEVLGESTEAGASILQRGVQSAVDVINDYYSWYWSQVAHEQDQKDRRCSSDSEHKEQIEVNFDGELAPSEITEKL